jgi:hypothetical protein
MMKKLLTIALVCTTLISARAQSEETSFSATGRGGTATSFVTDYQAIGINPANLGFETDNAFSLGVGEFGYGLFSNALVKDDVRAILFNNEDSLSAEDQVTLARSFLNEGITMNVDVMPIGFSLRLPKLGTFGFSMKGNMAYHTLFAGQAANIVFEGYNYEEYIDTIIFDGTTIYGVAYEPLSLGELFDDTEISLNITSEFNVAYGRKLFGSTEGVSVYGGFGYKYILGLAYLDINSTDGVLSGTAALGLDIMDLQESETPFTITSNPYEPVGRGNGFDVGLSLKIGEGLTFGASVVDMGKMTYTANVLQINDFTLDTIAFSGLTSTDPIQLISDILGDPELIAYSGIQSFTVNLPTKLRLGGSVKISDMLNVGVDAVFPMNDVAGAYTSPVIGLGGEFTVLKVIKLSTGFSAGGGYAYNIPAGIGFDFKIWEIGFATRDILTWFGESSPTVSFAAGVLRFKL